MTAEIKETRVNISVYFAAVLAVGCALSPEGYASLGMICCVLHEFGHLLVMRLTGCKVKEVSFGAYGMRIDSSGELVTPKKEALISFGGPMVNIVLIFVGLAFKNPALFSVNIILAGFNLIPVEGTDGYSILLNLIFYQKNKAALKVVSAAFLILLYILGLLVLFKSRYNFTLLAVAVYLTAFKFLSQGNQPYR